MFAQIIERRLGQSLRATPCRSSSCIRRFSATPLASYKTSHDPDENFDPDSVFGSSGNAQSARKGDEDEELDLDSIFGTPAPTEAKPAHAAGTFEAYDSNEKSGHSLAGIVSSDAMDKAMDEAFASPADFGVPGMRSDRPGLSQNPFSSLPDAQRTDSTYDRLAANQPFEWTGDRLRAVAAPADRPEQSIPPAKSARLMRGVHGRRERELGNTPDEAGRFHDVLEGIFQDLERTSKLSMFSPTLDPYGSFGGRMTSQFGASMRSGLGAGRRLGFGARGHVDLDDEALAELEELKEVVSGLATDVEVFEWAKENVFRTVKGQDGLEDYPKVYSHILALTMRILRTNFENPLMALALFNHAQTLSIESYLHGCLTLPYNEVITIRWEWYRDFDGVESAIREMDTTGVGWDKTTRRIIETVCGEYSRLLGPRAGSWAPESTLTVVDGVKDAMRTKWHRLENRLRSDINREKIIALQAKKAFAGTAGESAERRTLSNKPSWVDAARQAAGSKSDYRPPRKGDARFGMRRKNVPAWAAGVTEAELPGESGDF